MYNIPIFSELCWLDNEGQYDHSENLRNIH